MLAVAGSVGKFFVNPNFVVFGSSSGVVSLRMTTLAQLLRFERRRGDEVLQRRGERVRGSALQVGAAERRAPVGAAREGVEVDLGLAEGARRDRSEPVGLRRRNRRGVDRPGGVARPRSGWSSSTSRAPCSTPGSSAGLPACRSSAKEQQRVGAALARSYWISRSPAVRTGVTPLAEMVLGLVELEVHIRRAAWLLHPVPEQVQEPGARRRRLEVDAEVEQVALVRGDAAVTTLGTAVSSFVPLPKESSFAPLGWSALRVSATFAQSSDGAGAVDPRGWRRCRSRSCCRAGSSRSRRSRTRARRRGPYQRQASPGGPVAPVLNASHKSSLEGLKCALHGAPFVRARLGLAQPSPQGARSAMDRRIQIRSTPRA